MTLPFKALLLVSAILLVCACVWSTSNEPFVNLPELHGRVSSKELDASPGDRLCSSVGMNLNGCDLHAFNERADFQLPLKVDDDIYVCKDDYTPMQVYNILQHNDQRLPTAQFGKVSSMVHDKTKQGIGRLVAKRILKETKSKDQTLEERRKVLLRKQTRLQRVMADESEKYNRYEKQLVAKGYNLWSKHCAGSPYEADYGLAYEPKNLTKQQQLCYYTYWLW